MEDVHPVDVETVRDQRIPLTISVYKDMIDVMDDLVKRGRYKSRSDFVRYAIAAYMEEIKPLIEHIDIAFKEFEGNDKNDT